MTAHLRAGVVIPDRNTSGDAIVHLSPFADESEVEFDGTGVRGTATKTVTSNIQLKITKDVWLDGMQILLSNHEIGDTMALQVVDVDGILAPAGTVLKQFATNWQVAADSENQGTFRLNYKAKVLNGLWLRCAYTSTGLVSDVDVRMNFFLHKIMTP